MLDGIITSSLQLHDDVLMKSKRKENEKQRQKMIRRMNELRCKQSFCLDHRLLTFYSSRLRLSYS